MDNIGSKIIELRKSKNLTQAELGARLNISAQAVSKWENNQSEPDIDTMKKICAIFEISLDELAGVEKNETLVQQTNVVEETKEQSQRIVLGTCSKCKKSLYSRNDYTVRDDGNGATIICNSCLHSEKVYKKQNESEELARSFIKSMVVGGIAGIILFILGLAVMDFWSGLLVMYASFAFATQMYWDGSACNCMEFFTRSFRMPGIIFELSIDGIIQLILMKVILGFLLGLLSCIVFVIGFFVTLIYSCVSFPFALVAKIREMRAVRLELNELRNIKK